MQKILKISFEYDDHIDTLEGNEAQKWMEAANGLITFNYAHGVEFPRFPWKTEKKTKHARK